MTNYNRKCPACNNIIQHISKASCYSCEKKGYLCKSCAQRRRIERDGISEAFINLTKDGANVGSKNPFYGKTHTEEARRKIGENKDKSFFKDPEYIEKQSKGSSGKNNPMYGRTVFDVWVEKYGLEEANIRMENFKQKQSKNSSGANNPMYGKPSPQGSGNGWSGWYNQWFFRSLKELSYAVQLDSQEIEWKSAEFIKIPYINWDGVERTYHPDFLVNNIELIEIKPLRLKTSKTVVLKIEAAKIYCTANNLKFDVIDPKPLKNDEIKNLVETNKVKFLPRYKKLYDEKFNAI